jgi:asparagine synthase (glutamine-hydrolysing)
MFAVAVWDRRDRSLTLARDPLGIKPLFVTEQGGGLAFASEIKALRALPAHRFTVDERAVHDVLSAGHVRPPRTIFAEVRVLPPGRSLVLRPGGEPRERTYWTQRHGPAAHRGEAELVEEFRALWLDTVRRHLLADVPLGVFLSGGVDSSAVAAAMARLSDRPVRAFTIGFPARRWTRPSTRAARRGTWGWSTPCARWSCATRPTCCRSSCAASTSPSPTPRPCRCGTCRPWRPAR